MNLKRIRIFALNFVFLFLVNIVLGEANGVGFITSSKGKIIFYDKEKSYIPKINSNYLLNGTNIKTESFSHLFLKLSNNVNMGLLENTEVDIEIFNQKIFNIDKLSIVSEPSESKLILKLKGGTIINNCKDLSPLSEYKIEIEKSYLKTFSSKYIVSYKHGVVKIAVYDGNVTLMLRDNHPILNLNSPVYYETDINNLNLGVSNSMKKIDQAPKIWSKYSKLIKNEIQKVVFYPQDDMPVKGFVLSRKDLYDRSLFRPSLSKIKK